MKDVSRAVWRVLRSYHAKSHREDMLEEYGAILKQCEKNEPQLRPFALHQ